MSSIFIECPMFLALHCKVNLLAALKSNLFDQYFLNSLFKPFIIIIIIIIRSSSSSSSNINITINMWMFLKKTH